MNTAPPQGYNGPNLPGSILNMLARLEHYDIKAKVTTSAGKTLNLVRNGVRCGYINGDVLRLNGVLGYHFAPWGNSPNDACPSHLSDKLVLIFCDRYKCDASDIVVHKGAGEKNIKRTFLIIKNPDIALKVLLQDFGLTLK